MKASAIIKKYKLYHILFWLLLFGGWYFFRYQDYSSRTLAIKITLLKVADLALMVYVTNYLLIPQFLYKKKYVLFGFTFILLVFGSSIGKMWIEGQMMHRPELFTIFNRYFKIRFYDNVIPHFLLVSTGAAFKLLLDYAKVQRRLGEMAKEKAEAELNFLKSQINPHFLFNSLNSVYFLIDKENPGARQALHKFSDMLRYQLYECNDNKIPIEKEIGYLQDYVDLQKLRREVHDEVQFTCSENVKGFLIEPLLLIPFVENSFKHLSHFSTGKKNLVKINADRANGEFSFSVMNTIEYASTKEAVGGIGLKNVKRRLELLYPNKHLLEINEQDNCFNVKLKLKIEN
ncbi:MAG TPA: sensor histidine kinase [Chitinophagaceae bacterium]|jgi:sensor histidine kinase YesM|nr:sensor histidine kinase [Chitinophagaceae bacterium]